MSAPERTVVDLVAELLAVLDLDDGDIRQQYGKLALGYAAEVDEGSSDGRGLGYVLDGLTLCPNDRGPATVIDWLKLQRALRHYGSGGVDVDLDFEVHRPAPTGGLPRVKRSRRRGRL